MGKKLHDIDFYSDFFDVTSKSTGKKKTQTTKVKVDKWDYIKLNSFYAAEEAINEMRRQPMEWEKCLQILYLIKG